jgi:hypothetical protein
MELHQIVTLLHVNFVNQIVLLAHHLHNVLIVDLDSLYNQVDHVFTSIYQDNIFLTLHNHHHPQDHHQDYQPVLTQPLPLIIFIKRLLN